MRKILKRGMALGLSLMLGVAGSLEGVSAPYSGTVAVKAAVEESGQKAIAGGIDILDYESNASATEFVVNNIAGFEKIAELVNSGKESFNGKTIMLNTDLEYNKTVENNHNVIGDIKHPFNGIFDGAFHTISGININSDLKVVGLFGHAGENGKISKIILKNSSIVCQYNDGYYTGCAAGIVALTYSPVSECFSGSDVEVTSIPCAGGIVGESNADISKCINYSTIKGKSFVGGIVGDGYGNGNGATIKRCINYGTVSAENGARAGGISGWRGVFFECCNLGDISCRLSFSSAGNGLQDSGGISGGANSVINCYNAGQISVGGEKGFHAGGVAGTAYRKGSNIDNSYSVGKVKNGYCGAIACVMHNNIWNLSHCYWLTGTASVGVCEDGRYDGVTLPYEAQDTSSVFKYSQSQMQSQAFVDELNLNSKNLGYEGVWAADSKNINNGYPILKNVPYTIEDLINSSDHDTSEDDPYIPDDEETLDATPAPHFYEDHNYNTQATNSTIQIYTNGGTVAVPGITEKKNYKRCILYTDILPSYIYTVGKNGAIKPSSGKVVVGITASNQKPELVKGKIVDKSTSKIASASIKSGQITVTAKSQPGKVYLWAIDTGRASVAACILVTVKGAPTATNIYAVPDTDSSFTYGKTKQFKSGKISVGESAKVYLYPTYKENGAVQKTKKVSYTASVAAKSADYFSVKQSDSNPLCFEISAKSLKSGKSVTGTITFTCSLNGKKVAFKATAINQVTGISTANVSGMTKESDSSFKIKASDSEKTTGTFEMQTVCSSNTDASTDILKIYAMGSADGYDTAQFEAGKVKITKKRSGVQSKISMKPAKDKKTVIVTAAKGTKPVTAYFLAVYNNVNSGLKKGYMVISVTAE